MSVHRFELTLRVDDELLADMPDQEPNPDPATWHDFEDLVLAVREGAASASITGYTWVKS